MKSLSPPYLRADMTHRGGERARKDGTDKSGESEGARCKNFTACTRKTGILRCCQTSSRHRVGWMRVYTQARLLFSRFTGSYLASQRLVCNKTSTVPPSHTVFALPPDKGCNCSRNFEGASGGGIWRIHRLRSITGKLLEIPFDSMGA